MERMGKFERVLTPGLQFMVPILDSIKYVQSLKETAVEVPAQSAITMDNVTLELDGVLYYKIVDPVKASYGIEDADFAISQLAQTTMRSEIGRLTLDKTLSERTSLNKNIIAALNAAAADWGIQCLRYEIRDIHPPENVYIARRAVSLTKQVVAAMHQQVSAERKKRSDILESEGSRQSAINVAQGRKESVILESEAQKAKQINMASGESEAILLRAQANAKAIDLIAKVVEVNGVYARDAISLSVAEGYVDAFGKLAKEGTSVVVPANIGDAAGMISGIMKTFEAIKAK